MRLHARHYLILLAALSLCGCETVTGLFKEKDSDGHVIQTEDKKCWVITPENALHAVGACATENSYELQTPAMSRIYAKDELRATLRERLYQFLKRTEYPVASLRAAQVQVWLEAPALAPERAYLVAVMLSPGGNFLVRLPLAKEAWRISEENVQLLGKETYPSVKTKRPGVIVLQAKDGVTTKRLAQYVAACDVAAGDADMRSAPVVLIKTPLFSEGSTAQRLAKPARARQMIAALAYVPAGGEEAARAMIYEFSFAGN